MFKIDWNRKYTTIAIYACIVIAIAIIMLVVGLNFDRLGETLGRMMDVLNPIFVGIIIAYLCNPLLRLFENKVFAFVERKKRRLALRRGLALTATYLVVLLVITLFLLRRFLFKALLFKTRLFLHLVHFGTEGGVVAKHTGVL